jgi:hypothetical protein
MGKLTVRNSEGLAVEYGVGPGYRSMLHGLYRGVSWQTKERLNLGRPEDSVKGGRRKRRWEWLRPAGVRCTAGTAG